MFPLAIAPLDAGDDTEVVERKGIGHPDTICDALAETLSRNLCREYRQRFGEILHHNVDKALLSAGQAVPEFGGGRVVAPMHIYLAGRAMTAVGNQVIPIAELAVEGSRAWLRQNLHALDAQREVRIDALVRPASLDLQSLFSRRAPGRISLANDTSVGIGHAPLSPLERLVLAIERRINGRNRNAERPAWGEDVKVMGIRRGSAVQLTVACAMIGRYLADLDDYLRQKAALADLIRELAAEHGFRTCDVNVNAADDVAGGNIYLSVTGTSAEAGDDGQAGRGNRVNGLITPCRPTSPEAAAGKNPASHVGKIYNVLAQDIAARLVANVPEIASAQCMLVSKIGAPINEPAAAQIKIATRDHVPIADLTPRICELVAERIARIAELIDDLVSGAISVY